MRLLIAAVLAFAAVATPTPAHAATDVLPKLEPVRSDLAKYDIRTSGGKSKLRFIGSVANVGKGALHVMGKRESKDDSLTAYQRIEQSDGGFREVRIGKIVYHAAHDHYHLDGVSRYKLMNSSGAVVKAAPKVTFCLTDTEPVRDGTSPTYLQCSPNANADLVEMGISAGWKDVYDKDLPGQSFDVTDLMDKPAQEYTLEMTVNPGGILIEANRSGPRTASVKVKLGR
ncbi:MAG TPA: hypothetical protein DGT23_14575 [Micromonosporaceae bacterium]|nr:hypothetical protein [Micromonosporaceae bacterium]